MFKNVTNVPVPEKPIASYAVWANDEIRMNSSSGGMFTMIAKYVLDKGGRVFGAVWDENFFCQIKSAKSWEEFMPMRGSKYVQSNTKYTFREVKELLAKKIPVAYFGLPCQIAGLKAYLKGNTDGLITVDLICFCSPSNVHFRKYLEEEFGIKNVKNVTFREKSSPTKWAPTSYKIDFKNGESIYPKGSDDPYQRAFHGVLARNDTCNDCKYYKFPRPGDFTIGDFWGVPANWNDSKGTSVVLTNTKLAEDIMTELIPKFKRCEKVPLDWCLRKGNRLGVEARASNPLRFYFRELLKNHSFREVTELSLSNKHDVGLAVWINENFGNNLTDWALYRCMTDMGYNVLVIGDPVEKPQTNGDYLMSGDGRLNNFLKAPIPSHDVLPPTTDYNKLKDANNLVDMFVLGSDQLWRDMFIQGLNNFSLLDWVDLNKYKMSYGTSFGVNTFNPDEKIRVVVGKLLSRFQSISVRENSGADILKNIFGLRGEHVLDPVFLPDAKYYDEMAFNGRIRLPDNSYVGTYFLDPSKETANFLKKAAEKLTSGVYHSIIAENSPSIEEWLAATKYSDFWLTDSFHGTCLALIFRKQFCVIYDKKNWRGWDRFSSILKLLNLESRVVEPTNIEKFEEVLNIPIDYEKVTPLLQKEIAKSKTWLRESLEMAKHFRGYPDSMNKA